MCNKRSQFIGGMYLFWSNIKMMSGEYLRSYNKLRSILSSIIAQSEANEDYIYTLTRTLECPYFDVTFAVAAPKLIRIEFTPSDIFYTNIPDSSKQNISVKPNETLDETLKSDRLRDAIIMLDTLTGMYQHMESLGNLLVNKTQHLLETLNEIKLLVNNDNLFMNEVVSMIIHLVEPMIDNNVNSEFGTLSKMWKPAETNGFKSSKVVLITASKTDDAVIVKIYTMDGDSGNIVTRFEDIFMEYEARPIIASLKSKWWGGDSK